jgi:hypothetical protein
MEAIASVGVESSSLIVTAIYGWHLLETK